MKIKEKVESAIKRKVVLKIIERGTIQRQFFKRHDEKHPSDTADAVVEAYNLFADEMKRLYGVGYGCVKLVEIFKEHYINVTEKTILGWLKEQGVEIRTPLRDRTRQPHGAWERGMAREIERLTEEVEFMKKSYNSAITDLTVCESALRVSDSEKRSIARRLEACRAEVKEIAVGRPMKQEPRL